MEPDQALLCQPCPIMPSYISVQKTDPVSKIVCTKVQVFARWWQWWQSELWRWTLNNKTQHRMISYSELYFISIYQSMSSLYSGHSNYLLGKFETLEKKESFGNHTPRLKNERKVRCLFDEVFLWNYPFVDGKLQYMFLSTFYQC